jgi:hypothetical protein
LLVALLATALPTLALAGSGGRRNTALGLSGLAAYELLRGHTTVGALSAAGAAYSWLQYSKARKNEKRQARLSEYYRSRYYNSGPAYYPGYSRTAYYSSSRPYTRVRSYRSSYSRGRSVSSRHRRSSTYLAGYRAGYRRGVRVCRAQHARSA